MASEETKENPRRLKLTKFRDRAVMAPTFTPQHLKQVNMMPVSYVIHAAEPPNMSQDMLQFFTNSVVTPPRCFCKIKHNMKAPWVDESPAYSIDPHFALKEWTHKRPKPHEVPNLEKADGKKAYLDGLERLLKAEFEKKLLLYERYSQYRITIQTDETLSAKNMVILNIPGIHSARPPLEPGDVVLLRPLAITNLIKKIYPVLSKQTPGYYVEIHAQVVRTIRGTFDKKTGSMTSDKVVITWCAHRFRHAFSSTEFTVRFLPSTKDLQRCFFAIHWMRQIDPLVAKELLYPTETPKLPGNFRPSRDFIDPSLNEKQMKFVNMVLTRTRHPSRQKVRPPMILTGPAGTGKTRTLLNAILATLKDEANQTKRILVCTPSHTACDVVTRRLSKSLSPQKLLRLYDSSRPVEMVPAHILPYAKQGTTGAFIFPQDLLKYQVIVCTCSDADILVKAGMTNYRLRTRRQCLKTFVETTLQSSNLTMTGEITGAEETHFTHLFIDEAAQATEPQTLVPLSVVVDDDDTSIKVEIALAGDPRQLSPDIYSEWASKALQKSLLERLLRLPEIGGRNHLMGPPSEDNWTSLEELIEYSFQRKEDHDHLSVFLSTSYRGHPSFLMMPSKLFYFDKLRSATTVADEDLKWCSILRKVEAQSSSVNLTCEKESFWPIHFRGVIGEDRSIAVETGWGGDNSWSNPVEANEVSQIVQCLVSNGVSPQSIGIMAAFRAQVVSIRQLLRKQNLGTVNVGIVEDYQAVEREVIIISLTRSNEEFVKDDADRRVGLFHQPKRMNVALTRSEKVLIVVGNPNLMEKDLAWKEWLKFCFEHGLWYGAKGKDSMFVTSE